MFDFHIKHVMTLGAVLLLSGCGGFQQAFGYGKSAPDEFAVLTKPPLIIPPDYTLRPPGEGAGVPTVTPAETARAVLTGQIGAPDAQSAGETGLVERLGGGAQSELSE